MTFRERIALARPAKSFAEIVRSRELAQSIHRETEANRDFDHAQLAMMDGDLTVEEYEAARQFAIQQIAATRGILSKLNSLYSKFAR